MFALDLLSWGEGLFIFLLALVIIGPDDLPKVIYKVGLFFGTIHATLLRLWSEIERLSHLGKLHTFKSEQEHKKKRNESP